MKIQKQPPYSKQRIQHLYHEQGLSQSQIAKVLNRSRSRVGQIMTELGIQSRDYASASSNRNNQRTTKFTPSQEQLIYGSLLGDAGLYRQIVKSNKTGKPIEILRLTFSHSTKQFRYLEHKRELIGGTKIGKRTSGFGAIIRYFSFCHTPTLRPYAEICHDKNHRKKITREWLEKLDWIGIAYWYMDDGSLIISKGRTRPLLNFHTESFSQNERILLQIMLRERFGLQTRFAVCNKDPNQLKLVSRHKHEVTPFLASLQPHIIPSMTYKIRWLWNKNNS